MLVSPFPHIPVDVFLRIMFFSLYTGHEFSPLMQDDDISGHLLDFDKRRTDFMQTFTPVSKWVSEAAKKLCWRMIHITSTAQLTRVLCSLERDAASAKPMVLGNLCRRLEMRIQGAYDVDILATILGHTPKLQVFLLRNIWPVDDLPVPPQPLASPVVHALNTRCQDLRRIQIESRNEEPTLTQLKLLLTALPNLTSLHFDKLSIRPMADDVAPLQSPAHSLRMLSIGTIMRDYPWPLPFHRTGDLLRCFTTPDLLPSLRSVHVCQNSTQMGGFLAVFGGQLTELGFSLADRWAAEGTDRHLTQYCPNLRTLTCFAPEGPVWDRVYPIPTHKTVEQITVVYINVRPSTVPPLGRIVMEALLSLKDMGPNMEEVTVVAPPTSLDLRTTPWFAPAEEVLADSNIILRGPVFEP